jgi:hypothetical protein
MVKPGPGRLKPLARAIRNRVLSRHASDVLGRELEQEIFIKAKVLSEGGCRAAPEGHESYFGSTMISVPLSGLARVTRGDLDQNARDQLERAVSGSVRVRLRAMRIARAEVARRVPHRVLGTAQVESRVRLTRDQLFIDVDLEVPLGVSFSAKRR